MHFAASEGDLAVRVMARVEILDLPEGFPAAMSLEERSSLGARAAGKRFEVGPQALETPDPVLGDGKLSIPDALDRRVVSGPT